MALGSPLRTFLSSTPLLAHPEIVSPLTATMSVRNKPAKGRRWAVGPTKNPMHRTPGKRRGLWVYDGQRIRDGTLLVNQTTPNVFPGWNVGFIFKHSLSRFGVILNVTASSIFQFLHFQVKFGHMNHLNATTTGRVMLTTERMSPNWSHYMMESHFGEHHKTENLFKHFIHVIPDKQHQYFKLVEEI